jgi:hypothetical protein
VRRLLGEIDKRGFERSNHQVRFHDSFIRACSRVFYREEWAVHKAMIMRHFMRVLLRFCPSIPSAQSRVQGDTPFYVCVCDSPVLADLFGCYVRRSHGTGIPMRDRSFQ